jgi:hypothetical protein
MKTKSILSESETKRLIQAVSEELNYAVGHDEETAISLAVDATVHFFKELEMERTPFADKLAVVASELRMEPDLVRALFPHERVEQAYRRCLVKQRLARQLDNGEASGVFEGDATASVMQELGLDKLPAPPAMSPHFAEV